MEVTMRRHTVTRRSVPGRPGRSRTALRAGSALATIVLTTATALVGVSAMPAAAVGCSSPVKPTQELTGVPWPLAMWDLTKLPPSPGGPAVIVAVLDSGVNATHPQLSGQVLAGSDKLAAGNGQLDCIGHGTGVASLIAAKPATTTKFQGLAPNSKILPIRVSERIAGEPVGSTQKEEASPQDIAAALDEAVARKARVINLSFTWSYDNPSLDPVRAAIARAVGAGVVVVAAAGNTHVQETPSSGPVQPDVVNYPANWPGVVGVGAINSAGQRQQQSQVGPFVDLVAPGEAITVASPGGGHAQVSGTSFAAPLVAATAALIIEYHPELTGQQVVDRMLATTDPAAGGNRSEGYGVGVVNPIRAVTELVDTSEPLPAAQAPWPSADPQQVAAQRRQAAVSQRATWFAGVGLLVAGLAVVLTLALPAASRRRWRAAGRG
jgi:membrane-anchored mycosin MYCP